MSTATQETVSVMPWGIEADDPRMCDIKLQCVSGARLRSAIDANKGATDPKTGDVSVPLDQSKGMAGIPKLPGMQIHVNPIKLTYSIIDPLYDNEELLLRLGRWLKSKRGWAADGKVNGVPPLNGTLDPHQMKSLCREMSWLVAAGSAKVVRGEMPSEADVAQMAGYFLLNPGSIVPNTQPRYEKDLADWVDRLSAGGG